MNDIIQFGGGLGIPQQKKALYKINQFGGASNSTKMISPIQQGVDQTKQEVKIADSLPSGNRRRGIKRKRSTSRSQSRKRRRRSKSNKKKKSSKRRKITRKRRKSKKRKSKKKLKTRRKGKKGRRKKKRGRKKKDIFG